MLWTPETFWNATPYETSCAYVGYCRANGAGPTYGSNGAGLTGEMISKLRRDTEDLMKKNPDVSRKELKRLKAEGVIAP